MTPDLGVVGVLELERELHQGIGDVGGGFVGDVSSCSCSVLCLRAIRLLGDLGSGAEALAFDDDGIDVVEDAVEDG